MHFEQTEFRLEQLRQMARGVTLVHNGKILAAGSLRRESYFYEVKGFNGRATFDPHLVDKVDGNIVTMLD